MKEKRILVIGSMNLDMVVKTSKIPRVGETLMGGVFSRYYGGKGANQAMAANVIFDKVSFCSAIGSDSMGKEYTEYLNSKGIDTSLVKIFENAHSGVALITVAREGENLITVAPGANLLLTPEHLKEIDFKKYSHVAFQLEIPLETVCEGLKLAKEAGAETILTSAPSKLLPDEILCNVDYLVANELGVIQLLRGHTNMRNAAAALLSKGVKRVIITMGARGCLLIDEKGELRYPALSVRPIDSVGAGDCFAGSLMAGLKIYGDLEMAIKMANSAAGLMVSKMGAQSFSKAEDVIKRMIK